MITLHPNPDLSSYRRERWAEKESIANFIPGLVSYITVLLLAMLIAGRAILPRDFRAREDKFGLILILLSSSAIWPFYSCSFICVYAFVRFCNPMSNVHVVTRRTTSRISPEEPELAITRSSMVVYMSRKPSSRCSAELGPSIRHRVLGAERLN